MSYISHEDYKSLMSKFQANSAKGVLREALDPVGKEDPDIDNDGDRDETDDYLLKRRKAIGKAVKGKDVKEYGYADQPPAGTSPAANYPESWSFRERDEHPGEAERTEAENAAEEMKRMGMDKDATFVALMDERGITAGIAKQVVDSLFGADDEGNDEYPEDRDTFSDFNDGEFWEGLNPAPLQATGPTISTVEEDYMDHPFKLPKRTDTSNLDYDPAASRFEPDYMKTPGEGEDDDEFDDDDVIASSDDDDSSELPGGTMFKKMVAKDKTRYPFLRENAVANPSYGFEVLSPSEREQLKEYIEAARTIRKEIAKLAAKAGKKIKTEGGDMSNLTMGPSITSEGASHETIEKIEARIPEKVYTASVLTIKALRKAGLTDGEIKMFLEHEMEEIAKQAIDAQYDLPENASFQPEGTVKEKTIASRVKAGDVMAGSGEKVLETWGYAIGMNNRTDMSKVTVKLEYTKRDGSKGTRTGVWGKNTPVTVFRPAPETPVQEP